MAKGIVKRRKSKEGAVNFHILTPANWELELGIVLSFHTILKLEMYKKEDDWSSQEKE